MKCLSAGGKISLISLGISSYFQKANHHVLVPLRSDLYSFLLKLHINSIHKTAAEISLNMQNWVHSLVYAYLCSPV